MTSPARRWASRRNASTFNGDQCSPLLTALALKARLPPRGLQHLPTTQIRPSEQVQIAIGHFEPIRRQRQRAAPWESAHAR